MRRLIRHQYAAFGIRSNDGCRTAFNQNSQLLFRFDARIALMLNFMKMLRAQPCGCGSPRERRIPPLKAAK